MTDDAREGTRIEIAVVYFEKEAGLAALLARSVERYVDPEMLSAIRFLDNSGDQTIGERIFEEDIRPQFDRFSDRVFRHSRVEFGIPNGEGREPYYGQQALKLEVSRKVGTAHYLMMDAKNHFVRPITPACLFAEDGRPVSHLMSHNRNLAIFLRNSLEYIGHEPHDPVLPAVTPYMMITRMVRDLLDHLREKSGKPVFDLMIEEGRFTEFFLYYANLLRHGPVEEFYDLQGRNYATLFGNWPQRDEVVERVIRSAEKDKVLSFGVHARRFAQLTETQAEMISDLWERTGLFGSREEGLRFIEGQAELSPLKSR